MTGLGCRKSRLFGALSAVKSGSRTIIFLPQIMVDRLYMDRHNARLLGLGRHVIFLHKAALSLTMPAGKAGLIKKVLEAECLK